MIDRLLEQRAQDRRSDEFYDMIAILREIGEARARGDDVRRVKIYHISR